MYRKMYRRDQFVFTIRKDKAETSNVIELSNDVEIKKKFIFFCTYHINNFAPFLNIAYIYKPLLGIYICDNTIIGKLLSLLSNYVRTYVSM